MLFSLLFSFFLLTLSLVSSDEQLKCTADPCLAECKTCKRDGQCTASCKHEGGYVCISSTGSLGKNTSFDPPVINCKLDDIDVEIIDSFFDQPEFYFKYFYISQALDSTKCKVTRDNRATTEISMGAGWSKFNIRTKFVDERCMSKIIDGDEIQYGSILWSDTIGSGFDMPVPIIRFRCDYETNYNITSTLRPVVASVSTIIEDGVQLDIGIELCKVSTCQGRCPDHLRVNGQAIYTIGQRIHVGITTYGHESSVVSGHIMSLQNVFLSCESDPVQSTNRVVLFNNGCLVHGRDSLGVTTGQLQIHHACFSFIMARLNNCKDRFYIHAHVNVCPEANMECDDGRKTCPVNDRRRRSADETGKIVTLGPIFVGEKTVIATGRHSPVSYGMDRLESLNANYSYVNENPVIILSPPVASIQKEKSSFSLHLNWDALLLVGISSVVFSVLLLLFIFLRHRSKSIGTVKLNSVVKS